MPGSYVRMRFLSWLVHLQVLSQHVCPSGALPPLALGNPSRAIVFCFFPTALEGRDMQIVADSPCRDLEVLDLATVFRSKGRVCVVYDLGRALLDTLFTLKIRR